MNGRVSDVVEKIGDLLVKEAKKKKKKKKKVNYEAY
jgi:hypothetical protein